MGTFVFVFSVSRDSFCMFCVQMRTVVALYLFSYTSISQHVLRYLECVPVGLYSVVFTAPAIDCHSPEYKKYLGPIVVMMIVEIFMLPLIIILWLVHNRRRILSDNAQFKATFGILFECYTKKAFSWSACFRVSRVCF